MAGQTTFSRSIHFTGLDADPNMPQPMTLLREIEEDPTVAAAGITIIADRIDLTSTEDDVAVSMSFRDTGGGLDWSDIGATEQAAILAVLAAHAGTPTTSETQAELVNATTETSGAGWSDKVTIETPPLAAGKYRIEATCEHYLSGAPTTPGTDHSRARLWIDAASHGQDSHYHEIPHWTQMLASKVVKEGETISAALQHCRIGSVEAKIGRARLTVRWIDNESEV